MKTITSESFLNEHAFIHSQKNSILWQPMNYSNRDQNDASCKAYQDFTRTKSVRIDLKVLLFALYTFCSKTGKPLFCAVPDSILQICDTAALQSNEAQRRSERKSRKKMKVSGLSLKGFLAAIKWKFRYVMAYGK